MPNKALSKKVLSTLLTMSCVYLGGAFALPAAEAAENTWVFEAANSREFNPTKDEFVIAHWAEVKKLKDSNAGIEEYRDLLNRTPNAGRTETDVLNCYNLAQAFDDVVITNDASAMSGYIKTDIALGDKNLTIKGSDTSVYRLFALYGSDKSAALSGTGTLKLEYNAGEIGHDFTLLDVGVNSSKPGQHLIVDMAKLIVDGKANSDDALYGVAVDGYAGGASLTVNGATEIKIENLGGRAWGIDIDNNDRNTDASVNFQDLLLDVKSKGEVQGINISGGSPNDIKSNGLLNIDGHAALKSESIDKHGYTLTALIGSGGVNDVNFNKTAYIESTALSGNSYAIHARATGDGISRFNFADTAVFKAGGSGTTAGIYLRSYDSGSQKIDFKKEVFIDAVSTTNGAYGIMSYATGTKAATQYNFDDNVVMTVSGKNSMGVYTQADGAGALSKIDFADGLTLIGTSGGSGVTGIQSQSLNGSQSIININGETNIITEGNDNDYIARIYNAGSVVNVNQNGGSQVQGVGHLAARDGAQINWKMDTDGSILKGWLEAAKGGAVNVSADGNIIIEGGALIDESSTVAVDLKNKAVWNVVDESFLSDLILNSAAVVDLRADGNAYKNFTTKTIAGSGGVIKQDIDVRSMESDKVLVTEDFSGSQALDIYQKDNYVPAGDSTEGNGLVLASVNGNGTFTAKDREGILFYTHYDLASKGSDTAGFATDWYLEKLYHVDPTDKPTTSVETVVASASLNYHTWRTENDKLLKRMGELRNNGTKESGAWFRVHGSKIGRDGNFGFENKYTAYELGYDTVAKRTAEKTRYQGIALGYTDGSSSYEFGSGDNSSKSISFYNTEMGSKGHYLDVVFKISNMDNDFSVYDTNSNKITSDFNNTGVALSAEYGRKNDLKNGWYIEPQAQFTLGYLGGDSYTSSNGINVDQSGINSAVGRIGFNIGKAVGNKGIVYAKANLLHEFGGGYDVTMTDSSGRVSVSDSFNDTWFEYGVGAALAVGKNSQLYFDVERSTGSDFKKDWQWNVGARWNF